MNLFYGVLAYAMAIFNLFRALNGGQTMHLVMGALWLTIGIVFTVKHVQERKKAQKKREMRQKEE